MSKDFPYWCVTYLVQGDNSWEEKHGITNDREIFDKCLANSLRNPKLERVWRATEEDCVQRVNTLEDLEQIIKSCDLEVEKISEGKIATKGLQEALETWKKYVESLENRSGESTKDGGV